MIASRALNAGFKAWNWGRQDAASIGWATDYQRLLVQLDPSARKSVERQVRDKIKWATQVRDMKSEARDE